MHKGVVESDFLSSPDPELLQLNVNCSNPAAEDSRTAPCKGMVKDSERSVEKSESMKYI